tara:strand:+ start:1878 stop:3146 length:1269 start_codon:yes stop_codon:yes gene_type:complete
MNKLINLVQIDQSSMSASAQSRSLKVVGEIGAAFIVNVIKINGTSKESYYNFKTRAFTNAFIADNSLTVVMNSNTFVLPISFPADATGEVYSIIVIPSKNTVFKNGGSVVNKKITQVGQTTVYLELDEGTEINSDLTDKYTANPPDTTVSSIGSTVQSGSTRVPISWTLTNTSSDTNGFGFMLPDRPASNQFTIPDTYWFTQQVQVCDGTISSSTTVVLDSVTNLVVGMSLVALSSGSISGSPIITSIDGNTVTLSVAQSVNDGVSLYFRAYGPTLISKVFGLNISFSGIVAKGTQLTKTVRSNTTFPASDGAVTLNLNGTYGIAGASLVRISGYNINENANNNLITSVSASSSAGSVNVTFAGSADDVVSSIVPIGTTVYINGSHQEIKIEGTVTINKYPASNAKLALDLTKFITHGAATA